MSSHAFATDERPADLAATQERWWREDTLSACRDALRALQLLVPSSPTLRWAIADLRRLGQPELAELLNEVEIRLWEPVSYENERIAARKALEAFLARAEGGSDA